MAINHPGDVPETRDHLTPGELELLLRFGMLTARGEYQAAQEVAEQLWLEAQDAHKRLYQGLSNAMTAACARELHHLRGAREIARRTHEILEPYPRRALGIDLDALLESMDKFIERGDGPIRLEGQGASSG